MCVSRQTQTHRLSDLSYQDHLAQLLLDDVARQLDEGGDVADLHSGEGFDDAQEVLLQHLVVQGVQVRGDDRIPDQFSLKGVQRRLKVRQGSAHGISLCVSTRIEALRETHRLLAAAAIAFMASTSRRPA